jgi:hypothetical protein
MKRTAIALAFALIVPPVLAQDEAGSEPAAETATDAAVVAAAAPPAQPGVRSMSGMSILGNEEAPKSLVIVPWKSSKRGDGLDVSNVLDERPRPVDKEVFARELRYYELRTSGAE